MDSYYVFITFDRFENVSQPQAMAEAVMQNIQRELQRSTHISRIDVEQLPRTDPNVHHKDLMAELLGKHPEATAANTFCFTFIKDNNAEQYRGLKTLLTPKGVANQVIMQGQNLKDPSLLLRNLTKQVLLKFSPVAP
eukprot:TRINITY_DN3971_c0_g1_i1.p2 TRINITY_DN3971_c0_g1~~TRINITY_DN3971_c0_g1_i1.p2  ORF type:complete len:137 (+),score=48.09 TRINITY_DN3971_c0_g1_i1:139-549(+)